MAEIFAPTCKRCKRLVRYLKEVKSDYPDYHCAPVPPLGDINAKLVIVGLAPGKHGANRSGRVFTGDYAGILLFKTLYKHGFSNQPRSEARNDTLRLKNCRISNTVKCLPPHNKPTGDEIKNCGRFLKAEIQLLRPGTVLLALGRIAHGAVLRACEVRQCDYGFIHGKIHHLPNKMKLLDCYHCSRYNTQTKRLTAKQFDAIFAKAARLVANTGLK